MNQIVTGLTAAEMLDLGRYPIDALETEQGRALLVECRRRYREEGACLLQGFVLPAALEVLAAESLSVADRAYFCEDTHTAYLESGDDVPDGSGPEARVETTAVGSIAYDFLPWGGLLCRLYDWAPLKDFIAAVLGKPVLHHHADPLGACTVNVYRDGGQHGWHFDESEFTVTLMLQEPERGGHFEYIPKIRGRDDEAAQVQRALDGESEGVYHLPFSPGALLIFDGRQTLHRVTPVSGDRLRLVPVLCHSEQPGEQNSPEARQLFWGRTGELSGSA